MSYLRKIILGIFGFCLLAYIFMPAMLTDILTLIFFFIAPGIAWSLALSASEDKWLEQGVIGFGLVYILNIMSLLVLHYIPGPIPRAVIFIWGTLCIIFPIVLIWRRRAILTTLRIDGNWIFIVIVLIGSLFRLINAAYSEIEGDEALILLQSAQAIGGRDDMLFWHKKGPAELLLAILSWLGHNTINEATLRMPFVLASVMMMIASYVLSRHWQGKYASIFTIALVALNGYFIAYGRIAQYQSIMLYFIVLAFLSLERGRPRDVFLSGIFAGGALLAHYDAIMAMPALAYRFWTIRTTRGTMKTFWSRTLLIVTGGLICTVPFYLPFFCSSGFSMAFSYLTKARLGSGFLHNNLVNSIAVDAFYNSSYYLLGISILLVVTVLRTWHYYSPKWLRLPLLFLIFAAVTVLIWPDVWARDAVNWAFLPFSLLIIACFFAPRLSHSEQTIWLWFGVPFLFYLFVVKDPRTHIYNIFPAWILLIADALSTIQTWAMEHTIHSVRWVYHTLLVVAAVMIMGYPYVAFVDIDRDFLGHYPEARPAFYKTLINKVPVNVYFGFPRQLGWKVIGQLYERDELHGIYTSNQIPRVTHWYTYYAPRTQCSTPEYYFVANPHPEILDAVAISDEVIAKEYGLVGLVTVKDVPTITIYQRGKETAIFPRRYKAEDFVDDFDQSTTPDRWAKGFVPQAYTPTNIQFENGMHILGYTMSDSHVAAGTTFSLTLYWQTNQLIEDNYIVFVHLIRDGIEQQGTGDGLPDCAALPTPLWVPGDTVLDLHEITVYPEASCDACGLFVGIYDLFTGERVPVYLDGQKMEGDTVYLTAVEVSTQGD
ncbi:MAG: glycosyltransferase family 39 protein [Anaerolineae bacterium]|nr:glycosyltransferase family 39 protein [Anaerolineae bacterium]